MGFVREHFGDISIETRPESFVVHFSDTRFPHPEFYYYDMPDLVAALLDASGAESVRIAEQLANPPAATAGRSGGDD